MTLPPTPDSTLLHYPPGTRQLSVSPTPCRLSLNGSQSSGGRVEISGGEAKLSYTTGSSSRGLEETHQTPGSGEGGGEEWAAADNTISGRAGSDHHHPSAIAAAAAEKEETQGGVDDRRRRWLACSRFTNCYSTNYSTPANPLLPLPSANSIDSSAIPSSAVSSVDQRSSCDPESRRSSCTTTYSTTSTAVHGCSDTSWLLPTLLHQHHHHPNPPDCFGDPFLDDNPVPTVADLPPEGRGGGKKGVLEDDWTMETPNFSPPPESASPSQGGERKEGASESASALFHASILERLELARSGGETTTSGVQGSGGDGAGKEETRRASAGTVDTVFGSSQAESAVTTPYSSIAVGASHDSSVTTAVESKFGSPVSCLVEGRSSMASASLEPGTAPAVPLPPQPPSTSISVPSSTTTTAIQLPPLMRRSMSTVGDISSECSTSNAERKISIQSHRSVPSAAPPPPSSLYEERQRLLVYREIDYYRQRVLDEGPNQPQQQQVMQVGTIAAVPGTKQPAPSKASEGYSVEKMVQRSESGWLGGRV